MERAELRRLPQRFANWCSTSVLRIATLQRESLNGTSDRKDSDCRPFGAEPDEIHVSMLELLRNVTRPVKARNYPNDGRLFHRHGHQRRVDRLLRREIHRRAGACGPVALQAVTATLPLSSGYV